MKINNSPGAINIPNLQKSSGDKREKTSIENKQVIATGVGVDIRKKSQLNSVIKDNSPDDPIVSKKILDSLDLGFIKFNQKERDALAKIMNKS